MTQRRLSIDRQGAEWAYRLGFFGHCNPFDLETLHAYYWFQGKLGQRFDFRG